MIKRPSKAESSCRRNIRRRKLSRRCDVGSFFVAAAMRKQRKNVKLQTMKKHILLTIGLVALLTSATQATQQQLATSVKEIQGEATRTSEQLKETVGALNALSKQKKGDLRPTYEKYCAEVVRTQAAADWTASRVPSMKDKSSKYFSDWQNTVNSIANASVRKKSQKRLDSVKASYDKALVSLQEASEKFKPFMSDLRDIEKALVTDVTAGGVKAAESTIKSANWNYKYVEKSIKSALVELNKMTKALSTEAS